MILNEFEKHEMFITYILLYLLLWFSDVGSFVWHHDIWCSWTLWWVQSWSVCIPFRSRVSVPRRSDWVDQVPKCNNWTEKKTFQSASWTLIWPWILVSTFPCTQKSIQLWNIVNSKCQNHELHFIVCWDVVPQWLFDRYQFFRGVFCLHLWISMFVWNVSTHVQDNRTSQLRRLNLLLPWNFRPHETAFGNAVFTTYYICFVFKSWKVQSCDVVRCWFVVFTGVWRFVRHMRYNKLHRHKCFEIRMAVDSEITILRLWHHVVW